MGTFDPRVVVGLFTWNDDPAFNHREVDIEFSRWGSKNNLNAQFVVQPTTDVANTLRFPMPADATSTHTFVWQPGAIDFTSLHGLRATPSADADVIRQWSAFNNIPLPGGENPRINLWLVDGQQPTNRSEVELVVDRVEFIPLG